MTISRQDDKFFALDPSQNPFFNRLNFSTMQKIEVMNLKFIIRKNRVVSGFAPIQMQITIDGERIFFATGQKIEVEQWEQKMGRASGKSPRIKVLNEFLEKMSVDTHKAYNELKHLQGEVTAESLRIHLSQGDRDSRKSLVEVSKMYNAHTHKLIGVELNKSTWQRYSAYSSKLASFIKLKFKSDDIYLIQLKYNFIVEYDYYLKTEVKIHQNTIVKYIQYLNRVMDFAVTHEWLDKNIFQNFKCPVKESRREYLTHDELQRIIDKDIKTERLREVRDCFVFCCYTGYAYKDAANLTPEHIGVGITGRKWIYTSRQKNENVSNVPLLEQAQEIIDRYQNHPACVNKNRLLPMKSNQKLNAYLKELADICGINKTLTTHMARHTFATTVLLANGVSMEATSKMLGHSSIKTTQIYGRILESRVGAEMEMLSEKLAARKIDSNPIEAKKL